MGQRKQAPGLIKRGGCWHVDKKIFGRRIRCSTGTGSFEEAEAILARKIEEARHAAIFGVRPKRIFKEAVVKFLKENQHLDSLCSYANHLRMISPYIKDMFLENIHMGTLQEYIAARQKEGKKTRTINHGLKIVRHILNLAASEWLDENSLTWLASAPKIKLLPEYDSRQPYPLSWDEEERLLKELPEHLELMALFAINTGSRDKEVCFLRWEYEVKIPELNTSVFIIPAHIMGENGERKRLIKNGRDRLVVLNEAAQAVLEKARGRHPVYVFSYKGTSVVRIGNSAWQRARKRAGLSHLRVHDLKHTFGRRLRAAGVGFEDRQDLLGHVSGKVTTHYSAAEIATLLDRANKACVKQASSPILQLVRSNASSWARKTPTVGILGVKKGSVSA